MCPRHSTNNSKSSCGTHSTINQSSLQTSRSDIHTSDGKAEFGTNPCISAQLCCHVLASVKLQMLGLHVPGKASSEYHMLLPLSPRPQHVAASPVPSLAASGPALVKRCSIKCLAILVIHVNKHYNKSTSDFDLPPSIYRLSHSEKDKHEASETKGCMLV